MKLEMNSSYLILPASGSPFTYSVQSWHSSKDSLSWLALGLRVEDMPLSLKPTSLPAINSVSLKGPLEGNGDINV